METYPDTQKNVTETGGSLPCDILALREAVEELPEEYRAKISGYVEHFVLNHARRTNMVEQLKEAFSQLRLDIKYLIFDLESTRAERDRYRCE